MRSKLTLVLAIFVLVFSQPRADAVVDFNDGLIHDIDYQINGYVRVDYQTPEMQTTVNILYDGLITLDATAYNNSKLSVLGGTVDSVVQGFNNSQLALIDGVISNNDDGYFGVHDYSQANMSGGLVAGALQGWGHGQFTLSGGTVSDFMAFRDYSTLTICGANFEIDGTPVSYGEYSGIGHITGVLDKGNILDNDFYFYQNAKLILTPEPSTLLLLGLGAVMLRRKLRY